MDLTIPCLGQLHTLFRLVWLTTVFSLFLAAQTDPAKPTHRAEPSTERLKEGAPAVDATIEPQAPAPNEGSAAASDPAPNRRSDTPVVKPRAASAAQRNENVAVYQIDNNAIKEANVRLGTRPTIVTEFAVQSGYFASEHGQPVYDNGLVVPILSPRDWHGELWNAHQNSVFNARAFFQAGGVQPSHRNFYGTRAAGELTHLGLLTLNFSQRKIRGMVNGNVLVPLATERTPLTTNPALRAIISRMLAAFPDELPNRTDFDPRALNTNAPQRIDEIDGSARLDRDLGRYGNLTFSHNLSRSRTDAFQLVAGQNPDMDIHSHRSRIGWRRSLSAGTELALSAQFQRTASALISEPNAVGPRVRFGFQIQELGPDSQFPVTRAQNTFRYSALFTRTAGRHTWIAGGDTLRLQFNGIETNNLRGYFQFTNNFGRSAIENLLMGTPTIYEVTLGDLDRRYRNRTVDIYFADKWTLNNAVQMFYGLRWNAETAPYEADGKDRIPYGCDCNNVSPRLSFAVRLPADWILRTGATVSFAAIPPVSWQQVRNVAPRVLSLQVQAPDLLDPLKGISLNDPNLRTAPTWIAPDLVSSYAWQYGLNFEHKLPGGAVGRFGYTGSRSYKLMNSYAMNRAIAVPGIALTTATVDQRRPDQHYYETKTIVNGGIAYFDAAQATLELPLKHGLIATATYTFSKALDLGADFTSTAAYMDLLSNRPQFQYESFGDRKGLSNFDSTHALQLNYSYDLPAPHRAAWAFGGWQISGASLLKSGTPLTLFVGSDGPGFGNVDGSGSDRPNILDPSILGATISHPDVAPLILRRDRFSYIAPGDLRGNLARGSFRKSGIYNFNAALTKQWNGGDRHAWRAVLRGEAYNLTNTPQFDEPQRNLTSPAFGKITNTLNDGRVLQLTLRLLI